MSRISNWFKEMWPYAIAAVICGSVIPSASMSQSKSPDLYLIMMLMVLPSCVFTLGCILSLRREKFCWSIPIITLISSELSMTLPFLVQGVHLASVFAMSLIAALPTAFLLICQLFFACVKMFSDSEMSWYGYFALLLICLPLTADLLMSSTGWFTIASIAMGVSCAAVVAFMYFYKRETSYSLSAWTFMMGFPLLFLYNITATIDWARAAVMFLLPTASTFLATAVLRLVDRYRD